MSELIKQELGQTENFEDSSDISQQLQNISIAMIQFQKEDDKIINDIQNKEIKNSNTDDDLQLQNLRLQQQNQKLYQQLSQTENQLRLVNQRMEEFTQEKNQNNAVINDLKKLVDQQRDFIDQINNDQAYLDLTESLEISLQRLKEMEKKNEKLMEENLHYKTKYEESLIIIKNSKEETLNQQDRVDKLSQNYQQSSEDQLEKIKGLENEIKQLHNQLSNN